MVGWRGMFALHILVADVYVLCGGERFDPMPTFLHEKAYSSAVRLTTSFFMLSFGAEEILTMLAPSWLGEASVTPASSVVDEGLVAMIFATLAAISAAALSTAHTRERVNATSPRSSAASSTFAPKATATAPPAPSLSRSSTRHR